MSSVESSNLICQLSIVNCMYETNTGSSVYDDHSNNNTAISRGLMLKLHYQIKQ